MTEEEHFVKHLEVNIFHASNVLADMVIDLLARMPSGRRTIPAIVFLELKALCQIRIWENAGLRPWLPKEIPTFSEGLKQLAHQLMRDPASFLTQKKDSILIRQVRSIFIQLYVDHMLTVSSEKFMTETHLTNEQIKAIADCLWDLRHLAKERNSQNDPAKKRPRSRLPQKKQRQTRSVTRSSAKVGKKRGTET